MTSMEVFHQHLFSDETKQESLLFWLAQLTHTTLEQVKSLKSGTEWDVWHAEAV